MIHVSDRQRKKMASIPLQKLKQSIADQGLFHPLIVVQRDNGEWDLIAGGRRHQCLSELHETASPVFFDQQRLEPFMAPCITLGELSLLQRKEAEYAENKYREPLTWQEEIEAVAALNELRGGQKAEQGLKQTITETASELLGRLARGGEITKVAEAVKVAKFLDNPMVKKAKNVKEAVRQVNVLLRVQENLKQVQTAGGISTTKTEQILGDCFDILPTLPDEKFHCIITDPPYGINIEGTTNAFSLEHRYKDDTEYGLACYKLVAEQGYRLCKKMAHLYAFCDIRMFPILIPIFTAAGWTVWERPIVWKKNTASLGDYERGPRHVYEVILFARKGDMKTLKVADDFIEIPIEKNKLHAAQKPIDLYVNLLSRSVMEGDCVLDPFAGSGTLAAAGEIMKLRATSIEKDEEYYALQSQRKAAN
jgi:DNA modification methylase/ParB-like chromosome segregation protein Spo0J